MKTSTILIITVVITVIVSAFCIWIMPSKQDFAESNVSWNGLREWRGTVDIDDIALDALPALPGGHMLVVIPHAPYRESEILAIKNFISQGGTLVLLDDYGYGNTILGYIGLDARFSNKTMYDPLFCYKNPVIPRITNFSSAFEESGIRSIVLNHATSLTGIAYGNVLAWSSGDSFLDNNDNSQNDAGDSKGPFPIAAQLMYGKGTIILFSDPSIMINSMLGIEDNSAMVKYLMQYSAERPAPVLFDYDHLEQDTIDKSKAGLLTVRELMSTPYPLLSIVAIIFVLAYHYGFKKGELFG